MKKTYALLVSLMLVFSGCSADAGNAEAAVNEVNTKNESLVKEFAGTVNIFYRNGDNLLLSAEEGEQYSYYDIDAGTAEVKDSSLTELAEKYLYFEPVGSSGYVAVEEFDYKNTLKLVGKDASEKVITEDIGPADAINISISPKSGKLAYTALLEGSDIYGIYIYDLAASKNIKLMEVKGDGLIEGFNYLINWSDDEDSVIVHDKYIFDTYSGSQKGELKSAYSQWSPSGSQIAFLLEENSQQWLPTTDYYVYPGKKVCIYDVASGSYDQVFEIKDDEFIFGGITWGGEDSSLAFAGIKVGDKSQPDWYMKLNYSSVYVVEPESGKVKRIETNVDASDGTMIELGNLKFSKQGRLLSFTVGNYENSSLHIVNTETLEAKAFDNAEYLHWIDGENYLIPVGQDSFYFCRENSIAAIDEKLQDSIVYTSKSRLDDFYVSVDEKGILIFELLEDMHTARYLGE
jgi:hypothetical protein